MKHKRSLGMAVTLLMSLVGAVVAATASASGAFQLELPGVVINEVHYGPAAGGVEFVELLNPTDAPIDVSLMEIDGLAFSIPAGSILDPGDTAILTSSIETFEADYPGAAPAYLFEYPGELDAEGELVQLTLADGTPVDSVSYLAEDPWPSQPNGQGPSLSLFDPDSDNELSESWGISASVGGTPGAANDTIAAPDPGPPALVISEILYAASAGGAEFIELVNLEAFEVDLSGFDLEGVQVFASGTVVGPGGHLVLTNDITLFAAEHPGVAAIEWSGADVSDVGGDLRLYSDEGDVVDELEYEDGGTWPSQPAAGGAAIELSDAAVDNSIGSNWALSASAAGSPGSDGNVVAPSSVASLVAPIGETLESDPTFRWSESFGATSYRVWVNDLSNGGKVFDQVLSLGPVSCSAGICEVALGATFVEGDTYRWWVQARNAAGVAPWSTAADFNRPSDAVVPGQVALLAPSGAGQTPTPEFRWTHDADATEYRLWLQPSSGGGVIHDSIHGVGTDVVCGATECSLVLPGITLLDGVYQWWVQAQSDAGSGVWSSSENFGVGTGPPAAATLVGPAGAGAGTTPTYSWEAVSGASWYYLWVDDDAGSGTVLEWVRASDAGCGAGEALCSHSSVTSVSGSARWWIRTWNQLGFGPWSTGTDFTT